MAFAPSLPAVIIKGTGSYLPSRVLTNQELAQTVDTDDEWIVKRTGIRERRIAAKDETCADLAVAAGRQALVSAGIKPEEVDMVIVATMSGNMLFPSTACLAQAKLGCINAGAFDVSAACSGFLYALETGARLMHSPGVRHVLVIGAEKMSAILDWEDRKTCVLFGDGAGAVLLGRTDNPDEGIIGSLLGADGNAWDYIHMPAGGTSCPASRETVDAHAHALRMSGRETYKVAVRMMERCVRDALERFSVDPDEVRCFIPHQANLRIIEAVADRLGFGIRRCVVNLQSYGNTSAASVAIALDEAVRTRRVQPGDLVLMLAFGAGLTWASTLVRWHSSP